MAKKLYEVLGLDETADTATLRRAYRKLALQYHPDKHTTDTAAGQTQAKKKFDELTLVSTILLDENKRKQYDAGRINEKGEPVQAQESLNQQQFRSEPRVRRQPPQRTEQPHQTQQPFSKSRNPFFRPKPAHYFFFNSENDAQSFQPEYVKGPHFVYVTTSPLQSLFEIINASLGKNHKPTTSRSAHTSHVAANGDTSTYHRSVNNHPEHVSVNTNYAPRIERILDRLIGQMILLTLLENLSRQFENANDSRQTPGF